MTSPKDLNQRFNEGEAGLLRRAGVGAFLSVACSDGQIDERETGRFFSALEDTGLMENDRPAWEAAFSDGMDAFRKDAEAASAAAMAVLNQAQSLPGAPGRLLALARIAVVADLVLMEQESFALRQIAEALGLDPDAA